jgi:hypothetical protein
MSINIQGIDKAAVLAALYNAPHTQGMGVLSYTPQDMTIEEARELIKSQTVKLGDGKEVIYFDYVKGRVMKVRLDGDEFNESLYDRDNGNGASWKALEKAGLV